MMVLLVIINILYSVLMQHHLAQSYLYTLCSAFKIANSFLFSDVIAVSRLCLLGRQLLVLNVEQS